MIDYSDYTVIIPTLNEVVTIQNMIKALFRFYPTIRIIVADDESSDGTQEAVRQLAHNVGVPFEQLHLLERKAAAVRGITVSVLDAIKVCETKYFCVLDGDMQHPPEALSLLIEESAAGADLVIGTRMPYQENRSLHRTVVTKLATWAAKVRLHFRGLSIIDPMSGFFVLRTELAKEVINSSPHRFELKGYKVLFDFLRILDTTFALQQVYFEFMVRSGGESKLNPAHALYFARSLFR
ncbi:glycosyltransferase [Oligoflexia bacterium]|nr:glycosyltransferase [Oligoflexia bacterium]